MFLEGLSEKDCRMLDTLWALDTAEELDMFLGSLTDAELQRARALIEMLKLSAIDDMVEAMETYPEAMDMLQKCLKQN